MDLNTLYNQHLIDSSSLSTNLWGKLPKKLNEIPSYISNVNDNNLISEELISEIKKIAEETHKNFGTLNSSIKEILSNLNRDTKIIEIGHQPLYFGGSSFIFNKISFTIGLAQYLTNTENLNTIPLLFLGDHDQVQNELIMTRFPQAQSANGLELKSDFNDKNSTIPMAYLDRPTEKEFLNQCEKIRLNYRELFRYSKIKGHFRPLLEERLEISLDLLYTSYLETSTFGDWIGNFWSKFFIIKNKSPILTIKASDPKLRKLLLPYMENILQEENRIDLINILNRMNKEISDLGYKPGLSVRNKSDSPLFYECSNCITHSRIKLLVINSELQGKCPSCNEEISISYNLKNPDLSDHYKFLSPRVETRSVILNQLIKPCIRITGGGETTYHAQIIPYMRKKNIKFPLIIRHPRIYYNSPWSEKSSKVINFDNLNILQTQDMFKKMSEFAKTKEYDALYKFSNENQTYIEDTLQKLEDQEKIYLKSVNKIKNKQIQRKLDIVQLYLSHNYGKYKSGKTIQEINWNWMDLGILTGVNDLVGFYTRRLKPDLPLGSTFWLSAGQFM